MSGFHRDDEENYRKQAMIAAKDLCYGNEVIDVIEAFTSDLNGIEATDTGNILKYMCRWKHKNGLQDLEKAQWYLTHLIEKIKEKESK